MESSLFDQHVVVTGGGSGIGAATAHALAKHGARVTIVGRREEQLQECVESLQKENTQDFFSIPVDITDPEQVREGFTQAQEALGLCHHLVNNAGFVESAPFGKTSLDVWKRTLDVNLTGAYICIRELLPGMLKTDRGRIVNIASTAGLTGYPYVVAYCAAKHGVVGLTRALALEIAKSNVTVNAVCPGFTDTPLLRNSISTISQTVSSPESVVEADFLSRIPQERFIEPSEVASLVCWLLQDEQRSVRGQSIALSGGEVLY